MGGLGGDNMTIIIVCFLHGKPWETLVEKCKKNHADKKATTKLSGTAFTQFDRLSSDGPFPDVAILKASDESQNGESGSSSSHTSSPSSSPISDEKFDAIIDGDEENKEEECTKNDETKIQEVENNDEAQANLQNTEQDIEEASQKSKEIKLTDDDSKPEMNETETKSADEIVSKGE
jgi:hypothetical protein